MSSDNPYLNPAMPLSHVESDARAGVSLAKRAWRLRDPAGAARELGRVIEPRHEREQRERRHRSKQIGMGTAEDRTNPTRVIATSAEIPNPLSSRRPGGDGSMQCPAGRSQDNGKGGGTGKQPQQRRSPDGIAQRLDRGRNIVPCPRQKFDDPRHMAPPCLPLLCRPERKKQLKRAAEAYAEHRRADCRPTATS